MGFSMILVLSGRFQWDLIGFKILWEFNGIQCDVYRVYWNLTKEHGV